MQPRRPAQIGDVEERELRPGRPPLLRRVLADAEQQILADGMQVRRVAGDLQLAEHARPVRVREIDRVERVDLPERDHVADVADEAHGVDALALAEPADAPGLDERARRAGAASSARTRSRRPAPHHAGASVLTTRSTPRCSESDHWLRRKPLTLPLPR